MENAQSNMKYFTTSVVHLAGIFGYQYTEVGWFLMPSVALIMFGLVVFMIAVPHLIATPNTDSSEVQYQPDVSNLGIRFMNQLASGIVTYQIYMMQYEFFAGVISTMILCMILALIYIKIY